MWSTYLWVRYAFFKSNNIALQLLPQRLQTSHAKSRLVHSGCIPICQPHSKSLHAAPSCHNLFIFQDVDIYIYIYIYICWYYEHRNNCFCEGGWTEIFPARLSIWPTVHWSLSSARSIHSPGSQPTSPKSILILSFHLRLGLPKGYLSFRFSH